MHDADTRGASYTPPERWWYSRLIRRLLPQPGVDPARVGDVVPDELYQRRWHLPLAVALVASIFSVAELTMRAAPWTRTSAVDVWVTALRQAHCPRWLAISLLVLPLAGTWLRSVAKDELTNPSSSPFCLEPPSAPGWAPHLRLVLRYWARLMTAPFTFCYRLLVHPERSTLAASLRQTSIDETRLFREGAESQWVFWWTRSVLIGSIVILSFLVVPVAGCVGIAVLTVASMTTYLSAPRRGGRRAAIVASASLEYHVSRVAVVVVLLSVFAPLYWWLLRSLAQGVLVVAGAL